MKVYPLGLINSVDSTGTLCTTGLSYEFFEPNKSCNSNPMYSILKTTYETQTILTRKKAEPFILINYSYDDIWDKEYKQIEHFVDEMDGELTSFYVPDLSSGESPSTVTDNGSTWTINVGRTRIYSAVLNQKANYGMVWDGSKFRIGVVSAVSAGTSITIGETYGNLTAANAGAGTVYPMYQCYFSTNPLPNFKPGVFIADTVATGEIGGFMKSGDVSFVSKYKV